MYERHLTGANGEDIATEFLLEKGYKIVARNYSCNIGEIDIIAQDKSELVFVEVKTRTQSMYGLPADAVDKKKKTHIYKVAEYFVMMNHLENAFMRFDVIEIFISKSNNVKISHIENAIFEEPKFIERSTDDLEQEI